jgi:tetratricopeptide (TPR) repeat protein
MIELLDQNYAVAINDFSRVIDIDSTFAEAYIDRAYCGINTNNFEEAKEDCIKALKYKPYSYFAYNNLGIAYGELSRLDDAIQCFNKSIIFYENNPVAYYERGIIKQKKNDIEGACADWEMAAKLGYGKAQEMLDKYRK